MKELIELIKAGENDRLANRLQQDPSLAEEKTGQGISLLQFAAYCRNTVAIGILLQHTSQLDIFEASTLGKAEAVNQLLDKNPELLNSFSADGFTPLGLAAYFGHRNLARELLERGANPNVAANNPFKVTPLHSACATSNREMATLLIQYGADVNAEQMQNITPLHSAAHNGQTELVQLLVKHGAGIHAKMEDGRTPLQMAEAAGFHATTNVIKKLGGT